MNTPQTAHPATDDTQSGFEPGPDRLTPAAGLTFVALLLTSVLTSPAGANSSAPATAIARYYAHQHAVDLRGDYLSLVAFPVLAAFLVGLARRLASSRSAAPLVFALGLLGVGFELTATAIEISLASAIRRIASPPVLSAFYQVASRLFFIATLVVGLAVLCAAVAGLPRRLLPRWLSALGLATGLCMVVSGLSAASPHGPLATALLPGEALFAAYVASVSVVLLRSSGDPSRHLPGHQVAGQAAGAASLS